MKSPIETLEDLIKIQRSPGNYNCNEYMYGMLIGLECALACIKNEDAIYTEKPTEWLDDKAESNGR